MENIKLRAKPRIAEDFGVTTRTIDRWVADETLDFPRPITIKNRRFWDVEALREWKDKKFREAMAAA